MVKIITRGVPKTEYVYRSVCTSCRSLLEFKHAEMKHTSCQREGDYSTLKCPVCPHTLSFSSDTLDRIRYVDPAAPKIGGQGVWDDPHGRRIN
jgi:hypothetical protein